MGYIFPNYHIEQHSGGNQDPQLMVEELTFAESNKFKKGDIITRTGGIGKSENGLYCVKKMLNENSIEIEKLNWLENLVYNIGKFMKNIWKWMI